MATPLDITALKQFQGIFPFLFVLVIVYAVLARTDWFKDKQGIAALIAFLAAIMTLVSNVAMKTINLMAPWFVLLVLFIVLTLLTYMVLGFKPEEIVTFIKEGHFAAGTFVMVLLLIIGLGSLMAVLNEELGGLEKLQSGNMSVAGAPDNYGFWQTIFHPKVLGLAMVMLIALFTIKYMTSNE